MEPREAESARRFSERYRLGVTDAQAELDRLVFGSDHGSTGWTTVAQAGELARRLGLRPGDRLLDIGTGRGWPGAYLAETTGCDVVLSDRPVEGLVHATARVDRDGVRSRSSAVAAVAEALPFRHRSFDAVVHTDVLC